MNWKLVQREHVLKASDLVRSGCLAKPARSRGLFVLINGERLPAKDVARVAYLLAMDKPADAYLDFASGQTTLDMFERLGFQVERQPLRRGG